MRTKIEVNKVREFSGHKGSIFAMCITQDEDRAYSGGDDGIVAGWDILKDTNKGDGILRVPHAIYAIAHMGDTERIIVGSSDGTVYVIDLATRSILHTYRKITEAVYNIYVDEETRLIWILYGRGFLSILHMDDFREVSFKRLSNENLRGICVDETKHRVFIGTGEHQILVFDRYTYEGIRQWKAHDNTVFSLAVHIDGKYLLSGARDAHLNIWDMQQDFEMIKRMPAHLFTINDIAISPTGDYFATASRDKTIKVWDAYTFELLKVIDFERYYAHTHSVNKITWLRGNNYLISCGDDRRVIVWELAFT